MPQPSRPRGKIVEEQKAKAAAAGEHRSLKRKPSGMTATLEDSQTRPSRKSTRGSTNHGKPSQGKERTAVAQSVTPKARATRARVGRR